MSSSSVETGLEASHSRRDRREWAVCAGLLLACVVVKLLTVRHHALLLGDSEQLVNLRLARQLAADLPLGTLEPYMYGPTRGGGGIGPLVLNLGYVPLSWVFGTGQLALNCMALFWFVGSALLVGGIAARLLGWGGRIAGIGCFLLLPPAWLGASSTLFGTYFEASTLSLFALYLFLVTGQTRGSLPRRLALAAAFGLAAGFATAFSPAAAALTLPLLLLAVLLPGSWRERTVTTVGAAGGAALGYIPWISILFVDRPSHLWFPPWQDTCAHILGHPEFWPRVLQVTYDAIPVQGIWEGQEVLGLPDWIPSGWRLVTFLLFATLALRSLLGERFYKSSAWSPERRLTGLAVGGVALALPLALTLTGLGPDDLKAPRIFEWNWLRSVLVYPLAAIAWAWALHSLASQREDRKRLVQGLVIALVPLGAGIASLAVALGGEAPASEFRPPDFGLCPQSEPRFEGRVCVDAFTSWNQLDVAAALVEEVGESPAARRHALAGYGSVHQLFDGCSFFAWKLPLAEIEGEEAPRRAWRSVGAAAISVCGADAVDEICGAAPAAEFSTLCRAGAEAFSSLARDPEVGWTPSELKPKSNSP